MTTIVQATVREIKDYFEIETMSQFRDEWTVLSEAERTYFKTAVGAELAKNG